MTFPEYLEESAGLASCIANAGAQYCRQKGLNPTHFICGLLMVVETSLETDPQMMPATFKAIDDMRNRLQPERN